ncbi:FUSC family protein [Chitinilyticum piscinae]|uniref:FUSC family protein n=1 Tax=Chitinilyticum piscinae TaxID=2866724 RepID=A0A8J7KAQ4_9NEIS|nr:FUSC family protein [Chitinilyticum piscinae]MBE9609349.1 FUSC family protein [Chitinilyticum piscinae]
MSLHSLITHLKPNDLPWQRQRIILNLLLLGVPVVALAISRQPLPAALLGLGVFYTLLLDMGERKQQRLENMLLGIIVLSAGFLAGYFASQNHMLLWWLGLLGFIALGFAFNAGIALEFHLRYAGIGYLLGKVPLQLPLAELHWVFIGAIWTMLLSLLFAPRQHNPTALPEAPYWRHDLQAGVAGRFAGLSFGLILTFAVAGGMLLATSLHLLNPALVGITTLLVLRPDHQRTFIMLWQRLVAVCTAALLALAIYQLQPAPSGFALLTCLLGMGLPYAFSRGMAWFALCSTLTLLMLLGLLLGSVPQALTLLQYRVIDTLLGAMLAAAGGALLSWQASRKQAGQTTDETC